MKKNRNRNRKSTELTPAERQYQGRSRKINTMINSLIQNIDEEFITIEELKYVIRQVEFKLKERKKNGKNNNINNQKK